MLRDWRQNTCTTYCNLQSSDESDIDMESTPEFWKWKKAVEAKLSDIERRVTALERDHARAGAPASKEKKSKGKKATADPIDVLVADIADDAVEELNAEDDEFRGEILQYPHQFKKLATTEAENKNINAFFADPIKVQFSRKNVSMEQCKRAYLIISSKLI